MSRSPRSSAADPARAASSLPTTEPPPLESAPAPSAFAQEQQRKTAEAVQEVVGRVLVPPPSDSVPPWAIIPEGLVFPKGRQVMFLRLRAEWTEVPSLGDRQIICWPVSVGDNRLAINRSQGDPNRVTDELTKQMIRAIDGHIVDWTRDDLNHSPNLFWGQIGQGCRALLIRIYVQLNTLSAAQTRDFLENCVAVVTAG